MKLAVLAILVTAPSALADTALVDAVNKALETLTADKTLATVLGRYGITYRPPITR